MKKLLKTAAVPCALLAAALLAPPASAADPGSLTVHLDQPGIPLSPTFYGLMTEEINHSYDGGLYAELIQNRIFKDGPSGRRRRNQQPPADASAIPHWSLVASDGAKASIALDTSTPVTPALTTSLRLDITALNPGQRAGVANDGFWGIPAQPNTHYTASFFAKASPGFTGPLTLTIEPDNGGAPLASATIPQLSTHWQQYSVPLTTGQLTPSANNHFVISAASKGSVWFNLVSLFPPTFNDRPNGTRIDIMQKLAGLNPSFLRLPGGNYLEGNTIAERFNWKTTIGPLDQRPGHQCPWGYRSSDGLGLLEFLEWCEDLKVQPVLAVYAGYSLQQQRVPVGEALKPFVQDALDEIEYVTGDASTRWGAERIKDGHPAPFPLTYVEIGNEDFFDNAHTYDARFSQFFDAIKAKYPKLQLISSAPNLVHSRKPDVVDDHTYESPTAMMRGAHRHDHIDRNGPKIFMGEWASQDGNPTPTMNAALGDAAFLTGMEHNADVVIMQCYAPLFVNINRGASQWGTNLIGYNALSSFGSPSYYAQQMFAQNHGDRVMPVDVVPQAAQNASAPKPHGGIGVGTWLTDAEYKDITVTSDGKTLYQSDFSHPPADWKPGNGNWHVDNGALHQSNIAENCRDLLGDDAWTDYTLTLKARKLAGNEGFLILFHARDNDNYVWWNIGGWGNTRTALEKAEHASHGEFGPSNESHIDTNRWYDIRVELKGDSIKGYIDNKLVTEAIDSSVTPGPIFASANKVDATGDVILKVVNTFDSPQQLQINLPGVKSVAKEAASQVLTGNLSDVNSIDNPENIIPHDAPISDAAPQFTHEFPPRSVTIIRLKTQ
jgi:alpha-L-arabinofuranosidase